MVSKEFLPVFMLENYLDYVKFPSVGFDESFGQYSITRTHKDFSILKEI